MGPGTNERRLSGRALGLGVAMLGAVAGGAVSAAAAASGAGICVAPALAPSFGSDDPVCDQLVRTLALRVGLLSAMVTALMVLMVVGLARLAAQDGRRTHPARWSDRTSSNRRTAR